MSSSYPLEYRTGEGFGILWIMGLLGKDVGFGVLELGFSLGCVS